MASKIRIRIGDTEIEYEGSDDFLRDELPGLLRTVTELHRAKPPAVGGGGASPPPAGTALGITTGTIAARLQVKTGSDLALAAAARLTFGLSKDTFSRQELLAEMKTATTYYQKNYSGNLTKALKTLIAKTKLKETGTNAFSLTATARTEMEDVLADE